MTLGGWLVVALRRASNDLALVAAAALVVLVAATVLVAAAIYPDAVVRVGVGRTLAAADPLASGVSVAIDVRTADLTDMDAGVRQVLGAALGPAAGPVALTGSSEAYGIGSRDPQAPAVRFAFADGLDGHARLVRGRWPSTSGTVLEAVVSEAAARLLHLDVGSSALAISRLDASRSFSVSIVGVIALDDPADAFWGGDELVLRGTEQRGPFVTDGPLFIGRDQLLGRTIVGRASLVWRMVPAFDRFTPENLAGIGANVAALPDRLAGRLGRGQAITVQTDLPRLLGAVGARLVQADAGSTLVSGLIVVLALFSLVFVASLVVARRRPATSLLRARGAGGGHLLALATIEATVIAVPTAALGLPLGWLLAGTLTGVAPGGPPVAGSAPGAVTGGAAIVQLGLPVIGLAIGAALAAIVALVAPTAVSVGPLAGVHRSPGRQRAAALLQRSRLDLAVAALAAFALWRLRGSNDAAVGGGAAPLATAGPAIGLLAGAILLLRVVPVAGTILERAAVRGRATTVALTVRSVTRRSAAYGRPALLFAMSAAIALFALGYARTWEQSERDQVAQDVGAGVRGGVATGTSPSDVAALSAYLAIAGVTGAAPVAHEDFAVGSALPRGMLLGVVPARMPGIAAFRPDLADRPFVDLMAALTAARPDPPLIALPADVQRVRLRLDVRLASTGTAAGLPVGWAGLSVDVVDRDASGLLHRVSADPAQGTPDDAFVATLPSATGDPGSRPAGILAVEIRLALPGGQSLAGGVGIRSVETSAATTGDADWRAAAGSDLSAWQVIESAFDVPPTPLTTTVPAGSGDLLGATIPATGALTGPGTTILAARPASLAGLADGELAGLVDPTLLAAAGGQPGGVVLVRHASSVTRRVHVAAVVGDFPSLAAGFAVVDLPSLQLIQYAADGSFAEPDEWWLSVQPGSERSVVASLAIGDAPLQGIRAAAIETAARLDDPIALATSGMLILAALAAAAFAAIGFASAAWASTRSRLEEYAVGRALGLTFRDVAGWLLLEQAFPAVLGIAWGIGLGLALEWVVLPAVTVAPGGGPAVPPPIVVVPSDLIVGFVAIAIVTVLVASAALLRSVVGAGLTDALRGES